MHSHFCVFEFCEVKFYETVLFSNEIEQNESLKIMDKIYRQNVTSKNSDKGKSKGFTKRMRK